MWTPRPASGTTLPFLKVKVLVGQSCPTLRNPMDHSPPGSSVHRILQARILEWVAIPFSKGSSRPRDRIWVSCIAGRFFTIWAKHTQGTRKIPFLLLELGSTLASLDLGHVGKKSWVCLLVRGTHKRSRGRRRRQDTAHLFGLRPTFATCRRQKPAGDRHSHKQENVRGQVWTMEKVQQEEWDNFLSPPLEIRRRRKSLGVQICARVNTGTNRMQAPVPLCFPRLAKCPQNSEHWQSRSRSRSNDFIPAASSPRLPTTI